MKSLRLKGKTTALLLIVAFIVCIDAYAELQIYKVKGDVTVKKGQKTVKAERRAEVAGSDILTIPAGGSIDILESGSRRIYSSTETGKMSVKTLMEKAESHASDITRNINRKVISAVVENAGQRRSGYDALGMAIHETDAIAQPPVILPEGTSYLSYLLACAQDPDSIHQSYISLSKREIEEGYHDGAFNFVLHNSMRQPLYFNILTRDEDGIRLFFTQNPVAAPKEDTLVEGYTFLPDPDRKAYVAIASDSDFTPDDVLKLLEAGYEPDEDFYLTILGKE